MKKLLVVDGNSLINRAFYGVKPLTTHDGKNTNAVYGFINMLNHHLTELSPDYAAVAFDLRTPTFRREKCDYYKANRKGMPPELAEQFDDAKSAAGFLGLHMLTCERFEADDILGTLSTLANDSVQVYLLTGDRDSYQLISDNVFVLYASTHETVLTDKAKIFEKYGLEPHDLIQVKALMGDTSDNIPGVAGIGEKTALSLVQKFGTVENLYNCLDEAELSPSVKKKLTEGKDKAFESLFLAEICLDAPINTSLEDLEYKGTDKRSLCSLCEKLELNSVITRLSLRDGDQTEITFEKRSIEYTGIQSVADMKTGKLSAHFDFEGGYMYLADGDGNVGKLEINDKSMKELLCGEENEVTLHNSKNVYLYTYAHELGEVKAKLYDVMLASYVADPSGVVTEENLASSIGTDGVDLKDEGQKGALCALAIRKLREEMSETIESHGQTELLEQVEFPLARVLASMEHKGFLINREELFEYGKQLEYSMNSRMETIYNLAGCEFNINSPKQLGEVLFEKLGLPPAKKTKSGYSTDADTLEKLRPLSPVIDEILEYRTISKLKNTYADGLVKAIGEDGRLHTNFKQAFTLTGRLSSADPNLQNIPIRTPEGREIRKVFIPEPGKVLIDADYSQIELRLMAAMSGDETMIQTYADGEDIHTTTASQVFGVPIDEVTPELRKRAKAVNFGIIYGISDFSLAGDIKVTKREAGEYIRRYFEKYPGVAKYLENVKAKAYEDGYVTTLFGRRRYIPELKSRVYIQKMFGERVAMNAPIQGTAADIIKIAMVRVYNRLKSEKLDAKLILQVHDELIIESAQCDVEAAKRVLSEEMTGAAKLAVPLEISVGVGTNWDACH